MKAIVVYESLWGNAAAVARAIAEGIGPGTWAMTAAEATEAMVVDADLVVAGAPVIQFRLPTDTARAMLGTNPGNAPRPPDLSGPSLRAWLAALPAGHPRSAAYETRIW